jgi:fission process protein 1
MATAVNAFDTLLWQVLASVMLLGATINAIVKACRFAVSRTSLLPVALAAWMPTGVGLASIPIIIKPIDNAVDYLLENTTRHWIAEEGETN